MGGETCSGTLYPSLQIEAYPGLLRGFAVAVTGNGTAAYRERARAMFKVT
jgi:hypothetical protein